MRFIVKDMDIATGDVQVVLLNQQDAERLSLHHMDRLEVRMGKKKTIAVLDIAESSKAVKPGDIGLFEETLDALDAEQGDKVSLKPAARPKSLDFIKKKLDGKELTRSEVRHIVEDIVNDRLTYIELTSYVTANYARGLSIKEVIFLTEAMVDTGVKIRKAAKVVCDLHSIGGVPNNRTTMIIIPIIAAAGLKIPKTSSRAITSPAGTADTMEVFCPVDLKKEQVEQVVKDTNGCIVWGGAVHLAPADEKIVRVEHPLRLDAEGQMLASIMAKKASVQSTHLLLELPIGEGTKVRDRKDAQHLKGRFEQLAKGLGINLKTMICEEHEPVGNGIGPVLEARDVVWILQDHARQPYDLREKSITMAGVLLEFAGKARKGKGKGMATEILESGKAYEKFSEIVEAQGGKMRSPSQLVPGKHSFEVKAKRSGTVKSIDNVLIARIARYAGCPRDKKSGIYLHVHVGDKVKKGDTLFVIYSEAERFLESAKKLWEEQGGLLVR